MLSFIIGLIPVSLIGVLLYCLIKLYCLYVPCRRHGDAVSGTIDQVKKTPSYGTHTLPSYTGMVHFCDQDGRKHDFHWTNGPFESTWIFQKQRSLINEKYLTFNVTIQYEKQHPANYYIIQCYKPAGQLAIIILLSIGEIALLYLVIKSLFI